MSKIKFITIKWTADDIKARAAIFCTLITDEKVDKILLNLMKNHDASIGINWDVIDAEIERMK